MPMDRSDLDSLDALSAGELRGLIGGLVIELSALRSTVAGLDAQIATLRDENPALRGQVAALSAENRTLKDEIARLKELPRRPPDKPSGMERSTEAGLAPKKKPRSRRRRGPTLPRLASPYDVQESHFVWVGLEKYPILVIRESDQVRGGWVI